MNYTDQPTGVRKGEELDKERVAAFLRDAIPGLEGALSIRQFPGGYSNLTYMLTMGDRELVLRRPPFGTKAKSAHDMSREYRILRALRPVFPYCPEPLAFTDDPSIMGCSFYVMERLQGIILRRDLPPGMTLAPEQMRRLCENLIDLQVELHGIDYRKIGLENFGNPEGYVRRQVEGWTARYRAARTEDAPDWEDIMAWIGDNMPPDSGRPGIVHNDYKLDNCILDKKTPTRITGILDWEMATIGDPLMDLGNSLGYWVQADDPPDMLALRNMPTDLPGALTREEIIARYAEKSGRTISNFNFYLCFGLFRLAGIAQQIYYRYYHGQTRDERFKRLIFMVHTLEKAARRYLD